MSFSKHANNKTNNTEVMGKDYIQKSNDTTIYTEKMFYRNFTDPGHKFVLSLHYNGNNSYLFVNGKQELNFPLYGSSTGNVKVQLDLTNYATKDDVKILRTLM